MREIFRETQKKAKAGNIIDYPLLEIYLSDEGSILFLKVREEGNISTTLIQRKLESFKRIQEVNGGTIVNFSATITPEKESLLSIEGDIFMAIKGMMLLELCSQQTAAKVFNDLILFHAENAMKIMLPNVQTEFKKTLSENMASIQPVTSRVQTPVL